MTVNYMVDNEAPNEILYREMENEDGLFYDVWYSDENEWIPSSLSLDAFMGYMPATSATEEEALKIVNRKD